MKRMIDDNKIQVDANGVDVKDNLAIEGNLDVSGKISGGEIVEDMSGYSFAPITKENLLVETEYAGVVKTGNKITFSWSGKLTRTGTVEDGWAGIAQFNIPESVANKLITHSVTGLNNSLDDRWLTAFGSQTTYYSLIGHYTKVGTALAVVLFSIGSLPADTPCVLRYEVTFLLSDNLAA